MRHAELRSERGVALVVSLLTIALLSAIGAALVLATSMDTTIVANAGAATESLYAADAAFERTVAELSAVADLTAVLDGTLASAFVDGPHAGARTLSDGTVVNLIEELNLATCQKPAGCSASDLDAPTADRPWGPRNPRWRLFAHGFLDGQSSLGPRGVPSYVISLVADDPADDDGDPWRDGVRVGSRMNAGAGVLLVRAEAFGRRGARRVVEGIVLRLDRRAWAVWDAADPFTRGPAPAELPRLQVLSRREVR